MVEIYESIVRPELAAEFLAAHELSRVGKQGYQDKERLALELDLDSFFSQFPRAKIKLENAEADCSHRRRKFFHYGIPVFTPKLITVTSVTSTRVGSPC